MRRIMNKEVSEFIIDPYNAQETLAIWTEGNVTMHYISS